MFIGHFGVGLAAKKASPEIPLPILFIACQLLDFIWPILTVTGLESAAIHHSLPTFNGLDLLSVPYSHSLGMSVIWSVVFGSVVWAVRRSWRAAWITAAVVFSHWILDYVTHIPDLPLWFGPEKVGLGLWKSVMATFVIESAIFAAGIYLYVQAKGRLQKKQARAFWSMIAFLFVFYLSYVFGPQPPDTESGMAVAGPAFALWLIIVWAWYADRRPSPEKSFIS
jgi:hypothetical protein